jgi:hypothetical protein
MQLYKILSNFTKYLFKIINIFSLAGGKPPGMDIGRLGLPGPCPRGDMQAHGHLGFILLIIS